MANFSYRTIAKPAEGQYKEKGSRFLAFAYPVASEGQIKEHLEKIRKKYFDARHHCFAWILGADRKLFRAFDDGEPNHSAGDPILGQLRSKGLTHVLIVVVRYFGGVKLGVGGLITAYKTAAEEALTHAEIIEKEVMSTLNVVYDYAATPEVMRLIKEFDLGIRSQNFEGDCSLIADYKMRDQEKLFERMALMKAMGVKIYYDSIPKELNKAQINFVYANEADLLNVALFGITAKQWRDKNPAANGNIRDEATIEQLVVLSNLESINAVLIHQGLTQPERLKQLNTVAITQMKSLISNKNLKKLK